ncbi:MAG: thioredoxin family protein [Bacillota bacterium]
MNYAPLTDISAEEFDGLTFESTVPVMVFFGAERCQVCKELLPTVEEIASEYTGKMNFYWVDVDRYKALSTRFRLRGIPQLLIFSMGEVKERIGGLNTKEDLVEVVKRVVG